MARTFRAWDVEPSWRLPSDVSVTTRPSATGQRTRGLAARMAARLRRGGTAAA
jgi:hypothetical protein